MRKLLLVFILGMFLLSFTSALLPTTNELNPKPIEVTDEGAMQYPAIEVKDWFGLGGTLADLTLTEHTQSCGQDCLSQFTITTYSDSALVDDIKFYTLVDDGVTLDSPREQNIRSYQLSYWGNINDYETQCVDGKTIIDEKNGTEYTPQECSQIKVGSHEGWINYNLGDVLPAGTYQVKLEGSKRPSRSVDWIIKTQGKMINEWATWGNISTGSQAEVRLNSPANNSIQYTTLVTTNSSATVTGGAYLVNATLYDNSTGSWGARNTTNALGTTNITATLIDGALQSSVSVKTGVNITANYNQNLTSILIDDSVSGATTAYIYTANGTTLLATSSLSGRTAIFNYPLIAGNKYLVVIDKGGSTYGWTAAGSSYPYNRVGINITSGVYDMTNYPSYVPSIYSINTTAQTSSNETITNINTYPAGSSIKWNYQFCDTDGACGFATSNYTFSIDSTAPTITLNYPTPLINYGAVNGTLQLNMTATDTNLANLWYDYNGTNVTILGATSGVANLSNITLSTKKNVTIYANDTAGNLNTTTFSWDYKVFQNSLTYTNPITETALNTYTLNVTAGVELTSVYLNFNGTEYTVPLIGGLYVKQLNMPAVNVSTQLPVFYRMDYSGTNITSSTFYQNISKIVFQLCNTTINKTLFNFTTKSATSPYPLVNSTFKSTWRLSASSGGTATSYIYEDLNGTKSSYSFCTDLNTTNLYATSDIAYDAVGYSPNYYYINNLQVNSSNNQNITLYLLNDSLATTTLLQVQDKSQRPYVGYSIQIQSYDVGTNTFYTIGMAKTDFNGEDVVYLNWYDTLYRMIVFDTSLNVVKNTGTTKISTTPTRIVIGDVINFTSDEFEGFKYSLYYDNSTNNFVLTYTKPSGAVDQACLRVYSQEALNSSLICNSCETSSSATLFCNMNNLSNGTYIAAFYATGSFKLIDWINANIGGTFQKTIFNLLGNEDASFYAFFFAALITVALFVNAVFGIIALMIGLIGASALGFTALQWGEMMGIIILGGIVIWFMKR